MSKEIKSTSIDNTNQLLQQYDDKRSSFQRCTSKVHSLIEELLESSNISVQTIASRVKERESFSRKVSKVIGRYANIKEVTDIAGIRIITYFHDDVDKIAKIIEREFSTDKENSVDKRKALAPNTFGYLSLHYIATLNEGRTKLPEYSAFKDIKFEIQIRSVLQHAWAEIEHDMGYKSKKGLPDDIRRRFSRLAGLLEIGDSEFAQIRDAIDEYEDEVESNINSNPSNVDITPVTMSVFYNNYKALHQLEAEVLRWSGYDTHEEEIDFSLLTEYLSSLNIKAVSDVEDYINKYSEQIKQFAILLHSDGPLTRPGRQGFSLILLSYIVAFTRGGKDGLIEMFDSVFKDDKNMHQFADNISKFIEHTLEELPSK